jgi:hypothetical protein
LARTETGSISAFEYKADIETAFIVNRLNGIPVPERERPREVLAKTQ